MNALEGYRFVGRQFHGVIASQDLSPEASQDVARVFSERARLVVADGAGDTGAGAGDWADVLALCYGSSQVALTTAHPEWLDRAVTAWNHAANVSRFAAHGAEVNQQELALLQDGVNASFIGASFRNAVTGPTVEWTAAGDCEAFLFRDSHLEAWGPLRHWTEFTSTARSLNSNAPDPGYLVNERWNLAEGDVLMFCSDALGQFILRMCETRRIPNEVLALMHCATWEELRDQVKSLRRRQPEFLRNDDVSIVRVTVHRLRGVGTFTLMEDTSPYREPMRFLESADTADLELGLIVTTDGSDLEVRSDGSDREVTTEGFHHGHPTGMSDRRVATEFSDHPFRAPTNAPPRGMEKAAAPGGSTGLESRRALGGRALLFGLFGAFALGLVLGAAVSESRWTSRQGAERGAREPSRIARPAVKQAKPTPALVSRSSAEGGPLAASAGAPSDTTDRSGPSDDAPSGPVVGAGRVETRNGEPDVAVNSAGRKQSQVKPRAQDSITATDSSQQKVVALSPSIPPPEAVRDERGASVDGVVVGSTTRAATELVSPPVVDYAAAGSTTPLEPGLTAIATTRDAGDAVVAVPKPAVQAPQCSLTENTDLYSAAKVEAWPLLRIEVSGVPCVLDETDSRRLIVVGWIDAGLELGRDPAWLTDRRLPAATKLRRSPGGRVVGNLREGAVFATLGREVRNGRSWIEIEIVAFRLSN